jgi:hypothetical protein
MAVASGARGLEAGVVLRDGDLPLDDADRSAVADLAGPGVPLHLGSPAGAISLTTTS